MSGSSRFEDGAPDFMDSRLETEIVYLGDMLESSDLNFISNFGSNFSLV
ncbi:MAG: hypothetical protein K6F49_08760 [Saccharofermentans sp.]|nr:hypothetical protein [Saccharofermentans sp.]